MRGRLAIRFGGVMAIAALSACSSSTVSPSSVRTKATSYGTTITTNTQQALTAFHAMSSITALNNGLAPLQNAFGGSLGAASAVTSGTSSFTSALTADQSKTIEQYLSQRVFTDANVESSDGSSVTFRLQGDDVCPYILPDFSTSLISAPGATLDSGCVAEIDKLQLRVKATEPGSDALDLTLMVGPDKAAPLTLELRTNSATAVVWLDGVKGMLEFEHTLDSTTPVPKTMTGTVDLKVTFNRVISGKVDVTFSSTVRQAVDVEVQDSSGMTTFTTSAKNPWASLEVNEIDKAVVAVVDLGPTTASAPYVTLSGLSKQETTTLGGLTFSFAAQDGQAGDFVISNLGLGDVETNVTLDSDKVFSANLDPRQLSVGFRADPDNPGRTIFTVDPQFKLTSFYNDVPYGNTDPSYDNKTYTWSLTAVTGKPQIEPYDYVVSTSSYTTQWGTAVKIVNGTLTLSDGSLTLSVPQGQCLVESMATNTTSVVQQYSSAACP